MSKFTFRPIYGVIGRAPTSDSDITSLRCRWLAFDWPWSEDVREYGCPISVSWFGRKWCWGYRPFSKWQCYDWDHQHFGDRWSHFRVFPANYRDRESTCGDCWHTRAKEYRNY